MHTIYQGKNYQIDYKLNASNSDYTQHHVYHIKTDEQNYCKAHKAIETIMSDGSWREGEWIMKNKQEPSMANAFHTYHKFKYNEDLDVFVYTFVRPYDD